MAENAKAQDVFATTRWTVVLTAARSDTTHARQALAELCQAYWYPLYAYVRHRGYAVHDAEDLTQGFFARLLESDSLAGLSREKGKFRAFLLAALNHFMADEWDRASAQKRGGGQPLLSLDAAAAENRYQGEPAGALPPDRLFERQWALTLLAQVLSRLEAELAAEGKAELFQQAKAFLAGDDQPETYGTVASALGMSPDALKMAVHRLRRRYRKLLQAEIAQTVADPAEVADEIRHLFQVLS